MAEKKKGKAEAAATGAEDRGMGGFSLVLPLSLLAGGLVAYPALSAAAEGTGDLVRAVTLFLVATLVAMIGLGIVALLFNSFLASHIEAEVAARDQAREAAAAATGGGGESGPLPTLAIHELDHQAQDIGDALAATDALLHQESNTP
jgi:hypothetical protein